MDFDTFGRLRSFLRHLAEHLAHVRASVHASQGVGYGALRRDHWHDIELDAPLQVVDREHVGRIGHRHKKFSIQARDRHKLVRFSHFPGHQRHDLFGNG